MADDLEQRLHDILLRGVSATEQEHRKTRLDAVKEKSPDEWDDSEWDFANERGLIPADKQGEYEMRLLEKRQANERAALSAWQGGNLPTTGTATQGVSSGQLPAVPERPVAATLVQEVGGPEDQPDEAPPYEQWKKAELESEVDARNEGRDPESQLNRSGTIKELAQRLYEDDEVEERRAQEAQQ